MVSKAGGPMALGKFQSLSRSNPCPSLDGASRMRRGWRPLDGMKQGLVVRSKPDGGAGQVAGGGGGAPHVASLHGGGRLRHLAGLRAAGAIQLWLSTSSAHLFDQTASNGALVLPAVLWLQMTAEV